MAAFPDAKIIHMSREPHPMLWSNFKSYFTSDGNGFGHDIQDLIDYYALYKDLMQHWASLFPNAIHHVRYETLTHDPKTVLRGVSEFLNVPWTDQFLTHHDTVGVVHTVSSEQVRQPIYKGSETAWENYREFLPETFLKL